MQKKNDKVGNKSEWERNEERRKESEKKNQNRFAEKKSKFWLLGMHET